MLKGNSLTFIKRITAFLLCITAVMIFMRYIPAFASANAEEAPSANAAPEYKSFSDLSGRTVGMLTAAPFEEPGEGDSEEADTETDKPEEDPGEAEDDGRVGRKAVRPPGGRGAGIPVTFPNKRVGFEQRRTLRVSGRW